MDKYTKEGRLSYFKNQGRYRNPHKIGTSEYDSFERGWRQAVKRHGPSPVKTNRRGRE